jgi:hypothetical protein
MWMSRAGGGGESGGGSGGLSQNLVGRGNKQKEACPIDTRFRQEIVYVGFQSQIGTIACF